MGSIIGAMVVDMKEQKLATLAQLRPFLEGTQEVEFGQCGEGQQRYRHIEAVLRRFGYWRLRRADKGLVVRYLMSSSTGCISSTICRASTQCSMIR